MQTATRREDIAFRKGEPRPVRVLLCAAHPFLTFAGECGCNREETATKERFIVAGTDYGYLHTSAGDMRFWRSASGARRAAKLYRAI